MISRASIDALAASVQQQHPDLRGRDDVLTLLFGDVEDAPPMSEPRGQPEEHARIVRQHAGIHCGVELALDGDGFLLAFANAQQAVWCAIALQRAFAASRSALSDRGRAPRVRLGLHVAKAIDQAVKLAVGIAAQAQGGEILVSSALKERIESDALGRGVRFATTREVELEGSAGRSVVYTVQWGEPDEQVSPGVPA